MLEALRKHIDVIDTQIIQIIAQRDAIVKQIGAYKKEHNLKVLDNSREEQLHQFHKQKAQENDISEQLIEQIFNILINHSKGVQEHE